MKISVVTVCYNVENEIEETIESILNQSEEDFEYIIIDGESKDSTVNKIKNKINISSKKIVFISEKDKGIYDAMNKAINIANGEWIIFINAGDSLYDNNVLFSVKPFLTNEVDVVYGDIMYIHKEYGEILEKAKPLNKFRERLPFSHQAVFVKTKYLKKMAFSLEYKICADYDFFYKLFNEKYKFKYIEKIISRFDAHGISSNAELVYKDKYKITKNKKFIYLLVLFKLKQLIKKGIPRSLKKYYTKKNLKKL